MERSREPIYLLRMGRVHYRLAHRLMETLVDARRKDEIGDALLLIEHPPVITLGRGGGMEDVRPSRESLARLGIEVIETERGGRATYHGPGQLVAYPIMKLLDADLHGYLWRLEEVVLRLLAEWGIHGQRDKAHPGVWVGRRKIAAVGIAVSHGVASHGVAINVDPDLSAFGMIVPCGLPDRGVTSMSSLLGRAVALGDVEQGFVAHFSQLFGRTVEPRREPGGWLTAPAPNGRCQPVLDTVERMGLHTVCQEASCPNLGDCWARGTATFMILGDRCTRHCRFCNVAAGAPLPPDPDEPNRLAEAAGILGLRHVVVTSVARDDLPDGGAGHFAATVRAIRRRLPGANVELLIPDFAGSMAALETVAAAGPDILSHNLETVERLSSSVRSKVDYRRSLAVLAWARQRGLATKSGLMLGLGETCGEVLQTLQDLRRAGCDLLTLGQYLQPSGRQLPVVDYLPPSIFHWYREMALSMGFRWVAASPLVRSSYRAEEVWAACRL